MMDHADHINELERKTDELRDELHEGITDHEERIDGLEAGRETTDRLLNLAAQSFDKVNGTVKNHDERIANLERALALLILGIDRCRNAFISASDPCMQEAGATLQAASDKAGAALSYNRPLAEKVK